MDEFDYDLFVIGGGSGGVRAARMAAPLGARVALCEEDRMGGTCVNVGCVPKKLYVYGAAFAGAFEDAAGFGWSTGTPSSNWKTLHANKDAEIERLNGIYERLLENVGVEVIRGRGVLVDPHTVEVDGRRYTARYILVATGSKPWMPELDGIVHAISSREAFAMDRAPEKVVVVGGGYIACEFASIYQGYGADVTIVHRGDWVLRGFDPEIRQHLTRELEKKGIENLLNHTVQSLHKDPDGTITVTLHDHSTLQVDTVLFATGRRPNTRGLNLESVGVKTGDRGQIVVDDHFFSSVPSILAVGDVSSSWQLTPVALAEGMNVARRLFGGSSETLDHTSIPSAVFSLPNVGTVGLGEDVAVARGHKLKVFTSTFRPMKHTLTGRDEKTFMKLVVDADDDRVLGVHMVGPDAGEIIQGFAVALRCGATKEQFDRTLGIHPTAAEEFVTMRTPAR